MKNIYLAFVMPTRAGEVLVRIQQPPSQTQAESHGDTATFNAKFPIPEDLRKIVELVANGTIKTAIDRIYPPSEAAEALKRSERRHGHGRILLSVTSDSK